MVGARAGAGPGVCKKAAEQLELMEQGTVIPDPGHPHTMSSFTRHSTSSSSSPPHI